MSKTEVIRERNLEATDANSLVHNRYPNVHYHSGIRHVDYGNNTWSNSGIYNASLTSLLNLKKICVKARNAIENYNKNHKEKFRLQLYNFAPSSFKAALNAGIITGTPARKVHINKRYVNMDDPNDVITIDRWERRRAVYCARPDVDYNAIIEELDRHIKTVLEVV